jgi:S-adenosylmethionine:tRNA ribosyltransferase-isomerase
VGTTSVRTLESLYWHGVQLLRGDSHTWASPSIAVRQWEPYEADTEIAPEKALSAVLEWMRHHGSANAEGTTELMIVPGYIFRLCDAIITNFHQPQSTLLLLVGAFLGRTFWRQVYEEALHQGYRFLSYGDASLLVGRRGEAVE